MVRFSKNNFIYVLLTFFVHGRESLHPLVGDVVAHLVDHLLTPRAGGGEGGDRLTLAVPAEVGGDWQEGLAVFIQGWGGEH